MNKDIRLSVSFFEHKKTIKLQRRLGDSGIIALQKLWIYTAINKPTGILDGYDVEDIAIAAKWAGDADDFVQTLIDLKWIDKIEDGFSIHDWQIHNLYACYSPERSAKAKKAINTRWSKREILNDTQSNTTSINENILNDTQSNTNIYVEKYPSPSILSNTPYSNSNFSEIEKIVTYLNEKAEKSFKSESPQTFTYIQERMKEGFTVDDFKKVIDNKCGQWLKDPQFNQYLRPQTLFSTKFEGYLNETPVNGKKNEATESTVIRTIKTGAEIDAEIDRGMGIIR